jgi:hypothetical protein
MDNDFLPAVNDLDWNTLIFSGLKIVSVIEIVLRLVPTAKPYSILFFIHDLIKRIDGWLPNNVTK